MPDFDLEPEPTSSTSQPEQKDVDRTSCYDNDARFVRGGPLDASADSNTRGGRTQSNKPAPVRHREEGARCADCSDFIREMFGERGELPTEPDEGLGTVTAGSLNIRQCPSTDCPSIGGLGKGSTIQITGRVEKKKGDRWLAFTYEGRQAFVSARHINRGESGSSSGALGVAASSPSPAVAPSAVASTKGEAEGSKQAATTPKVTPKLRKDQLQKARGHYAGAGLKLIQKVNAYYSDPGKCGAENQLSDKLLVIILRHLDLEGKEMEALGIANASTYDGGNLAFTDVFIDGVVGFQKSKGLGADGILGPASLKAMGLSDGTLGTQSEDTALIAAGRAAADRAIALGKGAITIDDKGTVEIGKNPVKTGDLALGIVPGKPEHLRALQGPNFDNNNGYDKQCANFVSAILIEAGLLSSSDYSALVSRLVQNLKARGWTEIEDWSKARKGDVWENGGHTEIVTGLNEDGSIQVYGSNGYNGTGEQMIGPAWKPPKSSERVWGLRRIPEQAKN